MTERVARACARRPWRVLGGWALVLVASVVLIASFLGDALTSTAEVTTQTDSRRADQLLAERMGGGSQPSEVVVVRSTTLTADDPAFQNQLQRLRQQALATGTLDQAAMARVEELPVSPDRHGVLPQVRGAQEHSPGMAPIAPARDHRTAPPNDKEAPRWDAWSSTTP